MQFTRSEAKAWARQHYKGLDGIVSPSFTPNLSELDEDGIRHDVRRNIRQGMFSFLCQTEVCAMTFDERKRFLEIACDEAHGEVLVSMFTGIDSLEQDIELLKYFEKIGGTHTLLGWPGTFYPTSEDDIYWATRAVCDATNLAVDLWPKPKYDFARFHPSHFNPALIERLSDIPNVVAIKAYLSDGIGKYAEIQHRLGDKVLVASGEPEEWPITVAHYHQQWAGPGSYTTFDAEMTTRPRVARMFELFELGKFDEAMTLYWELAPITLRARKVMSRGWLGMKYTQWLTGGNGGMYRQPTSTLSQEEKQAMRAGVEEAGIVARTPEEEFYVGRINYSRGVRLRHSPAVVQAP
jgi:4-hydroxy-tetrahydrodipicolinate synthase